MVETIQTKKLFFSLVSVLLILSIFSFVSPAPVGTVSNLTLYTPNSGTLSGTASNVKFYLNETGGATVDVKLSTTGCSGAFSDVVASSTKVGDYDGNVTVQWDTTAYTDGSTYCIMIVDSGVTFIDKSTSALKIDNCRITFNYPITYSVLLGTTDVNFTATSYCGNLFDIFYNQNGGNYTTLALNENIIPDGIYSTYDWDTNSVASGGLYKLKVCQAGTTDCKISGTFSVVNLPNMTDYYNTTQIDEMANALNITISNIEAGIVVIEGEIDTLQSQMTDAQTNITDLDLAIITAQGEIDSLEERMASGEGNITELQTRMTDAETAISTLQSEMLTIQGDIDALESRMNDTESAIIILQEQMDDVNTEITNLHSTDADLQSQIDSLSSRMTDAESRISSLEERMDSVESRISSLEERMTIAENDIDSLESRVTILEDTLDKMNHGTINLKYINGNSYFNTRTLRVWGEAPYGADYAEIILKKFGGQEVYNSGWNSIKVNKNSYEYFVDVSELERMGYDVIVQFYDGEEWMNGYNVGAIFDTLTNYGIKDIITSTRVETLYNPSVSVPLTYSVRIDETFNRVQIIVRSTEDSDRSFYQTIRGEEPRQSLVAEDLYTFADEIDFSELGTYNLVIEVLDRYGNVVETSESFNIEVVALENEIPDSEMYITSPEPNVEDVYWLSWEQLDSFDARLILNEGTSIQYCRWDITPDRALHSMDIQEGEGANTCYAQITEEIASREGFAEDGVYTLTGSAQFTGPVQEGTYIEDTIFIGVDNTDPIVTSVVPEAGVYSGDLVIIVETSDEASGISEVWVILTDKNDSEVTFTLQASYNGESGKYEVTFNTIEMGIPDGQYDITATAYDVAGNSDSMTVDPVIDNTAPVIEVTEKSFDTTIYENRNIFVRATITDNLAGVDKDNVQLILGNYGTCSMTLVSGDEMNGVYETTDCEAPFVGELEVSQAMNILINAKDKAEPQNANEMVIAEVIIEDIVLENSNGDITLIGKTEDDDGNDVLTFQNKGEVDGETTLIIETENGNQSFTFSVETGTQKTIVVFGDFIISTEQATVTDVSYNSESKSLTIVADGTGNQIVLIYVDGKGAPTSVSFDSATISSWSYDSTTKIVTANVTYGSPHTLVLSWYIAPVVTETTSSGGGGGGTTGGGCMTQWECTEWSTCVDGTQTRTCSYPSNYCRPSAIKPIESQSCAIENENNSQEESEIQTDETEQGGLAGITGAVVGFAKSGNGMLAIIFIAIVSVAGIGVTLFRRFR